MVHGESSVHHLADLSRPICPCLIYSLLGQQFDVFDAYLVLVVWDSRNLLINSLLGWKYDVFGICSLLGSKCSGF